MINNKTVNQIKLLLNKYKYISLFFHERPDGDAWGSCFAFYYFLKSYLPKTKVAIIGVNNIDDNFLKKSFDQSLIKNDFGNEDIKNSLGIILDTSNSQRVYTQQHLNCDKLVRIDHHPKVDTIGQVEIIEQDASSTCEILFQILKIINAKSINVDVAKNLYIGLNTDTGNFSYALNNQTFLVANELIKILKDQYKNILKNLRYKTLDEKKTEIYLNKKIKYCKNYAYLIIPKNFFKNKHSSQNSYIYLLADVTANKIWTSLYYEHESKIWKGSIRSHDSDCDVSLIAKQFGGGGHKNASGFILKSKSEFKNVIKEIEKSLNN